MKLTAQFVARNGRQFLTSLMNREARNYQFDFLRPQHSLFQYFTRLLEQYTKVFVYAAYFEQKSFNNIFLCPIGSYSTERLDDSFERGLYQPKRRVARS